jgi:uncharacterized membrane protein
MNKNKGSSTTRPPAEARGNGSSDELTRQNVEAILRLEEAAKGERTRSDLVAEAIANFCGSMVFVWVHVVWFGVWLVINLVPGIPHIDHSAPCHQSNITLQPHN